MSVTAPWGNTLTMTSLATSMAVNALMTGMIVFKILMVFLEFKPTSVERTLGSLGSTEDSKLRHVIFIVIESGMVLFAIQLVRVVLTSLMMQTVFTDITGPLVGMELVIGIHEMFNVIIKSFLFYIFSFTDDPMICICLARASHQQLFWCGPQ